MIEVDLRGGVDSGLMARGLLTAVAEGVAELQD